MEEINLSRIAAKMRYEPKANPFLPHNLIDIASAQLGGLWKVKLGLVESRSDKDLPINFSDFWGKTLYVREMASTDVENLHNNHIAYVREEFEAGGVFREMAEDWTYGFINRVFYRLNLVVAYPQPYDPEKDREAREVLTTVGSNIKEHLQMFEGLHSHILKVEESEPERLLDYDTGLVLVKKVISGIFQPWRPVPIHNGEGSTVF